VKRLLSISVVTLMLSQGAGVAQTGGDVIHHRKVTMVSGVFPPPGNPVPFNGQVFMKNDDFGRCISHVKVLIQKRAGTHWRTIFKIRTDTARPYGNNGGQTTYFKNEPRPSGNTFRAFMPELRFGSDVCVAAHSATGHWKPQP
jgi:hypothetical protein